MENKKLLLEAAFRLASEGYKPENKGSFEKIRDSKISAFTPQNIRAIYDELEKEFFDVQM